MKKMTYDQVTAAVFAFAFICAIPAIQQGVLAGNKVAMVALLLDGILIGVASTKAWWS